MLKIIASRFLSRRIIRQRHQMKTSLKRRLLNNLLMPLFAIQGVIIRSRIPVLPEAPGHRKGLKGKGKPLSILMAGDSSMAGVGASAQDEALSGELVSILAQRFQVEWELKAGSGWRTSQLLHCLDNHRERKYDVALVSIGINDITSGQSPRESLSDRIRLVELLRQKFSAGHILISGKPPIYKFPALPNPLRWYLDEQAALVDNAIRNWAAGQGDCDYLSLDYSLGAESMASDGFHPGPQIYKNWAETAAGLIIARWATED